MKIQELVTALHHACQNPVAPLPDHRLADNELAPLVALAVNLIEENRALKSHNRKAICYIRDKINQLLQVIGTLPLRPEELEDDTLLTLDPIGVVAESFAQILEHQRETNKNLELAMEEIEAIFEAVGCGVLVVDEKMRVQAYNRQVKLMFPTFTGSWDGIPCHNIVCRDSRLSQQCPFRKVLDTGEIVHFNDWPVGDRYFDIVATPIKNRTGKVVKGVLLYHDTTSQKMAASALSAEKERLAVTLRSIAEGVITTDVDGNVMLMNRVAEELTGWRQREACGQPTCEVFWIVDEKSRSHCIKLPSDVISSGDTIELAGDTVLIARDGYERLVSITAAPIRDHDRETVGVVMVFRDITEQKRLDEEILNARRIESLGILAGGIAHDFNNLLTGILGNITLARMTSEPSTPLAEKLSRAEKACLRARDLTQQLLTFSKGGAPVRKTATITDLLKETALFALRGSNVQCHLDISPDLWPVEVDEGQIAQVVNNLVINADQAMPDGGTLTVGADNITVGNRSHLPLTAGRYIKIAVQDTGTGIEPDHLDKIFDPYFSTKKKGSGLGLASCFAIIKKHDGSISVESKPGQGATFTFYLPAAKSAPVEVPSPPEEATPPGTGRILIMDDEEMILELAKELLTADGFQVETATDGKEAIAAYQKAMRAGETFDVVIMDLTIPGGMGGKETIQRLREIDPGVRAIVSSGYSTDAAMADFVSHGFKAVVPKPYRAEMLLRIIHRVMSDTFRN
ncbi:MAG: ATP-binding protein [Desulfobulbaceae bacterium]|nr:ATP-binding protein [Desulfobulbaceae bacterium]